METVTYIKWKKACADVAAKILGLDDIFAEDDPYDLSDIAPDAHKAGQSPETFVREAFAEDLASQEHDAHLLNEALEADCE